MTIPSALQVRFEKAATDSGFGLARPEVASELLKIPEIDTDYFEGGSVPTIAKARGG